MPTPITYPASSAYADTGSSLGWRLDIWVPIDIPADTSDIDFTITPKYNQNPMLLSQDMYSTPALYWVFSVRNIDVLRDPIWDLNAGLTIKVPTIKRLNSLGITA